MYDAYDAYIEYKAIVDSGDTSSPRYHEARSFYEDRLRQFEHMRGSWQIRAEFAASMIPPFNFNIVEFAEAAA